MEEKRRFRVVVVGGGLLGLTAAHMLAKTDLDFVVLEQHDDLMPEIGSLLSLMPPTFRVLDQLDVLDAVTPVLTRVERNVLMSANDGTVWKEEFLSQLIEINHGHGIRIVHRPHYVKALHASLSEEARARIHVQKRVVRIEVTDNEVAAYCADGTVERGDIIIGADGVHSRTRQAMQSLKSGAAADVVDHDQPSPYVTTYRMFFGNLPPLPALPAGTNFECAAQGVSTQILTGTQQAWFAVYEKLATPTAQRRRWTEDDKRGVLEKWGTLYMAPGYTLADAYRDRRGDVGLINLEEGLLDTWAWKRVVLVGDAVRKLEPHAGLGYNAGVGDLVVLVNGLRRLAMAAAPTTEDLEALFSAYQAQRMQDTPAIVEMSEKRARMCAWLGLKDWVMARFLVPWLPLGRYSVNNILGPILCRSPVLDWLDEKQLPARAMPYVHLPRQDIKESIVYNVDPPSKSRLPLLTGTLVVAALATVGLRFYRRI